MANAEITDGESDPLCKVASDMRAAVWHGRRDVGVDVVDDPVIADPTDAIISAIKIVFSMSDRTVGGSGGI